MVSFELLGAYVFIFFFKLCKMICVLHMSYLMAFKIDFFRKFLELQKLE